MDCVNVETYLFLYFALLIIFGNLAIYLMKKNVVGNYDRESIKPNAVRVLIWEVALPKHYLTNRGRFWRKASIGCCIGFAVFLACWSYFPNADWVCEFQMIPR
jgi:hypothetical protein